MAAKYLFIIYFHVWPPEISTLSVASVTLRLAKQADEKSYLISDSKECTLKNHDLVIINQLLDNQFDISNVAYPIHL